MSEPNRFWLIILALFVVLAAGVLGYFSSHKQIDAIPSAPAPAIVPDPVVPIPEPDPEPALPEPDSPAEAEPVPPAPPSYRVVPQRRRWRLFHR